jgi:transcriptional regulator with XRE-family HTH domain
LRDLRGYANIDFMSTSELASNWIPDVATFGARLALVRWRMGWNLREAERECNITQNLWGGWEAGKEPRSFVEVVNRITLRTGVNRVWLMTGEGSPERPEPNLPSPDYKAVVSDLTAHRLARAAS